MKEFSDLHGKRSFLALSSLLQTLDIFGLDAVQKTKKAEKHQLRMLKNCLSRLVKGHDSHFFCCKKCAEEKSNLYYEYCRYTGNESTFKGSVLWCFQNQCDEVHGATN